MAAVDRSRCSSAVSVDIDPGWYEGQPETADEVDATVSAPAGPVASSAAAPAGAPRVGSTPGGSHVPTVLTKLQKWGDYQSFGEPVWPTKFIPMKTPLSHEILDNWQLPEAPKHRLTVSSLLEAERAAGRRVGLLLDLSNHDCLYDVDIPPDVEYIHVQLVAKELPPLEFVREVGRAASGFWASHPDQYIAIHCAYGFNRTGFVVCSYLIEHCGLTVDQALHSFAASRPPGVKHERFKQELWARYGNSSSSSSIPPPCPQLEQQRPASSSNSSSRTCLVLTSGAAAAGAGPVGLNCSACSTSNSSSTYSTARRWPIGCSSPADGQQQPDCTSPAAATEAAAAARCACCHAKLTPDDVADVMQHAQAVTTTAAEEADRSQQARLRWPADEPTTYSSTSCFARSSSPGVFAATPPPPPPLPPQGLTHSSSRTALLSSSPALRITGRCWSSNSVGDNSSIGASPTSSTADLVMLRTSCLNSAASSGLDSSSIPCAPDTPHSPMSSSAAAAVGQDALMEAQWLLGGGGAVGSSARGTVSTCSSSLRHGRGSTNGSGAGMSSGGGSSGLVRGGSAGSCSITGVGCVGAAGDEGNDGVTGDDSAADEGCFEMDPCTDLPQQQQQLVTQQHQHQQQQAAVHGAVSSGNSGRHKSVTFQAGACCQQAAPGCGAVQQLNSSDLDTLLASVRITHSQQQQQSQHDSGCLQHPGQLQQCQELQLHGVSAAEDCGCSCHSIQQQPAPDGGAAAAAAAVRPHSVTPGHTTSHGGVGSSSSSSSSRHRPSPAREESGREGVLGRRVCWYSSEDGALDGLEIENESFGKLTSADLLRNLRALQRQHDSN